jgi:hypothetical protein
LFHPRTTARLFGFFFILAFLSYGFGSSMARSLTSADNSLLQIFDHQNQLVVGVILMAIVHSFLNISLPVLIMPILKPHGQTLALGYLSFAVAATVVLIIGAVLLLMQIPVAEAYQLDSAEASLLTLNKMLTQGAYMAYQMGMALWGIGGVMMAVLLYRSRLVPRLLPIWGVVGYLVFATGTLMEMFGLPYGVILALPGGLFELALSGWLIIRGFSLRVEDKN